MDPISGIVAIIAAGATAALKETAGKAVKDAYEAIKTVLASRLSSLGNLEQDPKEPAYRQAAETEIRKKALDKDANLLERIQALEDAISREPPNHLSEWGIDVGAIRAAKQIVIKNLQTDKGPVRVRDLEARDGGVEIEGIIAGKPPKN